MDAQKVDMYVMANAKFFESHQVMQIKEKLFAADESKWSVVQTLQFRDPTIILIVSLIAGTLGIDRFIIGDTGLGVAQLAHMRRSRHMGYY